MAIIAVEAHITEAGLGTLVIWDRSTTVRREKENTDYAFIWDRDSLKMLRDACDALLQFPHTTHRTLDSEFIPWKDEEPIAFG